MIEEKQKRVEDIAKEAEQIKCPVKRSLYFVDEFLGGPMCGRCFPCSMGSYEARVRLREITEGMGSGEDLDALKKIADTMLVISMCKKGKDTARYLLDALGSDEFKEHVTRGVCAQKECEGLIQYRIRPEACIMCDLCRESCKHNAIIGEKKRPLMRGGLPYEIRQLRCVKCGDCVKVCPTNAIEIINIVKEEPVNV